GLAVTSRALYLRLLRECLHFRRRLVAASIALALVALSQLYLTWLLKRWLEGPFLGRGDRDAAALTPAILTEAALVTVFMVFALFASRYLVAGVNQSLLVRLRDLAVRRILSVRLSSV